ncbi:MAG: hypothetical protein IH627_06830, partial [Rubrivivax sp.]|nr:hypothetical protein [Rubrivivax sp.]
MKYRRPLLIVSLDGDARAALGTIRRVAPQAERLLVVACLPTRSFAWLNVATPLEGRDESGMALDALREAARGAAATVDIELLPELHLDALAALAAAARIDLLVAAALPLGGLAFTAGLRAR